MAFSAAGGLADIQNRENPCIFPDDQGIWDAESTSHQTASSANQSPIFAFSAEKSKPTRVFALFRAFNRRCITR